MNPGWIHQALLLFDAARLADYTPVPVSSRVRETPPSVVTRNFTDFEPVDVGSKVTLIWQRPPAATDEPQRCETVNMARSAPKSPMLAIGNGVVPRLRSQKLSLVRVAMGRGPNASVSGLTVNRATSAPGAARSAMNTSKSELKSFDTRFDATESKTT